MACPTTSCGTPIGLTKTGITQTSAILHWNAVSGAIAYIVHYKITNSTALEFTTVTSSTNSIHLTTLTAGTYYIWQVQAVCSTTVGGISVLSATAAFVTPSVTIYPNPANGFVNVSLWLDKQSSTTIVMRNSFGQVVYSYTVLSQDGSNDLQIDTSEFSSGIYILNVQTSFYTTTSKLFIGH